MWITQWRALHIHIRFQDFVGEITMYPSIPQLHPHHIRPFPTGWLLGGWGTRKQQPVDTLY